MSDKTRRYMIKNDTIRETIGKDLEVNELDSNIVLD